MTKEEFIALLHESQSDLKEQLNQKFLLPKLKLLNIDTPFTENLKT
jgi:hypothetical protein